MANLPETPSWEAGIFQLETTTPATGGPSGAANTAPRQLANRTAYLKQEVEARAPLVHTHTASQISDSTAAGRTLLTAGNAAAQRTALSLGTAALSASTDFLSASGGSVSGTVTIQASSPTLNLNATDESARRIFGLKSGAARWAMHFGNNEAESGGNAGTNFAIGRYSDAGTFIDFPISISRASGDVTFSRPINTSFVQGGAGGGGALLGYGGANFLQFGWDTTSVYWVVDNAVTAKICTQTNAKELSYAASGGSPSGIVLNGRALDGAVFGINVDAVSDERVKTSIQPTAVDALAKLKQVEVCSFDLTGEVSAWLAGIGKSPEEAAALAQEAEPAHVDIGFVAQQLRDLIPEAVRVVEQTPGITPLPTDMLTVNLSAMVPYLVRALQQQSALIEDLAERIEALEEDAI